jgi:hypothetical protein
VSWVSAHGLAWVKHDAVVCVDARGACGQFEQVTFALARDGRQVHKASHALAGYRVYRAELRVSHVALGQACAAVSVRDRDCAQPRASTVSAATR